MNSCGANPRSTPCVFIITPRGAILVLLKQALHIASVKFRLNKTVSLFQCHSKIYHKLCHWTWITFNFIRLATRLLWLSCLDSFHSVTISAPLQLKKTVMLIYLIRLINSFLLFLRAMPSRLCYGYIYRTRNYERPFFLIYCELCCNHYCY